MNENKKLILDFIKKCKIAVLSTNSATGWPESAVLEFGETEDLEIIFDTLISYRKYQNLRNNDKVSLVIGWDEDTTVQYEGVATELKACELKDYKKIYFQKNPKAQRWQVNPEIRYFKIKPRWIRYSDLSIKPWKIIELNF